MSIVDGGIRRRVTVPSLIERKIEGKRLVMLTAYDFTSARLCEDAGAHVVLVGDSLGMVIQGHADTLRVTLDQMVYHCSLVSRACERALVVADMPFLTYHAGIEPAILNAGRCIQEGGTQAVKVEGGKMRAGLIRNLVDNGIPVLAHIGLTPQSLHTMGGFKVQGKTAQAAIDLLDDAAAVEEAGAFAVVLECIPAEVAYQITARLEIPTIGIGAGPACDGQVLVFHDLLGLYEGKRPRFVRRYAELGETAREALGRFAKDVTAGRFPSHEESFHLSEDSRLSFLQRCRHAGLSEA